MKRIWCILCLLALLTGCTGKRDELDRAMALRAKLLAGEVNFDTVITADYGDKVYTFTMACTADAQGRLTFSVLEPLSIAGVTGEISATGGKLTFDDQVLSFEQMADDQFSPVSAPWILIRTLRSGYLTSCQQEGQQLRISIDDSYEEDALHLDIWLDSNNLPFRAEILWQGRRILSLEVKNFVFV